MINCIAAITIDGKIALRRDHYPSWTSAEDLTLLREMLDASDCVVVGGNTFAIAKKQLSKRNCIVFTRSVSTLRSEREGLIFCNPNSEIFGSILEKYSTIAILGGTGVYSWFLERGQVDNLYLTIEPLSFGYGLPLFEYASKKPFPWRLASSQVLNSRGSLFLHYTPL